MIFTETKLKGAFIAEIKKIGDDRGFFGRSWCANECKDVGINPAIAQMNTSFSKHKGTLRGMHFQRAPHEETKFIRCTRGAIFDVMIDLRPDSPTFKQWFGVELTEENYTMAYIPEKFAHGFITLCDNSEVSYLVSQFYAPESEGGCRWDDPEFGIEWPAELTVISDKDNAQPYFKDVILP